MLERFKQLGRPMALVVQEYGEIEGVITLTDLLEALVGDLLTAGEPIEQEAMQREDGSWLLDGAISIEELADLLGIEYLPDQSSRSYETLGGLVMQKLGRIPIVADSFEWVGWRFEVMDMDGCRVDKVLATPLRPSQMNL